MAAAMAAAVQAVPTLTLSDGSTTVSIWDNSAVDTYPGGIVGAIGYVNPSFSGTWNVEVVALTMPAVGGATLPRMELHVIATRLTAGANTLTIIFTESGFGPAGSGTFSAVLGGTTVPDGTVRIRNYADVTLLNDSGNLGGSPIPPYNATGPTGPLADPFSLTMQTELIDSVVGSDIRLDASLVISASVPDGGSTLLFLGGALGSLGFVRWRRKH